MTSTHRHSGERHGDEEREQRTAVGIATQDRFRAKESDDPADQRNAQEDDQMIGMSQPMPRALFENPMTRMRHRIRNHYKHRTEHRGTRVSQRTIRWWVGRIHTVR